MSDHSIYCPCADTDMNISQWNKHFMSDNHLEWFTSTSDNINEITITCACGSTYNYATCHNHFKSNTHKLWQKASTERYNNVLLLCKCGDITTFINRTAHNNKHVLPKFADD